MTNPDLRPIDTLIVAVPETAGSALYGMLDVLLAAGNIWQTLVRAEAPQSNFKVRIISPTAAPFSCGNGIPVRPDLSVEDDPEAQIVILPELWLGPDEHLQGRYPQLMEWIRRQHERGASIYSACSGAVMLAETGLLDQCEATSHWGYQDLFRRYYPNVRFRPEPNLARLSQRAVRRRGTTWRFILSPGTLVLVRLCVSRRSTCSSGTGKENCLMQRSFETIRMPILLFAPAKSGLKSTTPNKAHSQKSSSSRKSRKGR